jgi:hypothetical protein
MNCPYTAASTEKGFYQWTMRVSALPSHLIDAVEALALQLTDGEVDAREAHYILREPAGFH